jgi:transposase
VVELAKDGAMASRRQADVDTGEAACVRTEIARELRELRRRNRELEATIEIQGRHQFFAREYDPRRTPVSPLHR